MPATNVAQLNKDIDHLLFGNDPAAATREHTLMSLSRQIARLAGRRAVHADWERTFEAIMADTPAQEQEQVAYREFAKLVTMRPEYEAEPAYLEGVRAAHDDIRAQLQDRF